MWEISIILFNLDSWGGKAGFKLSIATKGQQNKRKKKRRKKIYTWNISVSESSLYSTITAWFLDKVYDIECCFVSNIASDVCGDWTI